MSGASSCEEGSGEIEDLELSKKERLLQERWEGSGIGTACHL